MPEKWQKERQNPKDDYWIGHPEYVNQTDDVRYYWQDLLNNGEIAGNRQNKEESVMFWSAVSSQGMTGLVIVSIR